LQREYELDVRFAPFLLDPTTPPEGKPRQRHTHPDDPPTAMEERGQSLGITFSRGRTMSSNSHLALEAAEFAADHGAGLTFHRAMFKSYFDDLDDIGKVETVVQVGESAGLDAAELRQALESGEYRQQVDQGIAWSRQIGVTGVPTFVFDEKYGVVGAQDHDVFVSMMSRLGREPKS
jgi:predicted DsbA family dithiol-disulfide isomerase